jgi:hypothetical protein
MLLAKSSCGLWWWLGSLPPPLLSTRSRVGSTIVATSSIAWRRLTCAFTSTLSLGSKGVSWSTIILEAKVLCAGVQ